MDFLTDWLTNWLKELLIGGIMGNLEGLFDTVNTQVGEIAAQVGTTPAAWHAGVFSLIRQLSETVILPIAGMVLTFVATYELIQMLLEKNNMHEVDVANLYKWIFKTACAILILSNTFNIVMAVFENIICCGMELTGCSRRKSSLVNLVLIIALSMPCVLGYNLWAWDGFAVFGGAVLDFEDFLVSNLFLPLGSLVYLLFCVTKYGWGWDNYKKEVNTGKGLKMHDWMRGYLTYVLPVIVLFIFAFGIYDKFFA